MEYARTLRSAHLDNERTIWVSAPRNPGAKDLVVFLDGELYRDRVGAMAVLQSMLKAGDIADAWFVFVSMQSVEARWTECPCHSPFAKFIAEELLPWLGLTFPDTLQMKRRTLIGLSYTGLAAAYIAQQAPGVFQNIICQSGSFWWNNCWLVNSYAVQPVPPTTEFYLEVGTRETQENVQHRENVLQVVSQIEGVRRFRDVLLKHCVPVRYSEYEGGHEFDWWSKTLPVALQWALPSPGGNQTVHPTCQSE